MCTTGGSSYLFLRVMIRGPFFDDWRAVTGLSLTMATSSSSNDSVDKLDDLDGRNIDDLNDENIINNDDRFEKFDRR